MKSNKIRIKENTENVRCALNLPPNAAYRITKMELGQFADEHFVLIDGERPVIQHKTEFEKKDDLSHNFKWLNTSDYGKEILSNVQKNQQFKFTNKGKTLIISSFIAISLELDYRLLEIPSVTGILSEILP